MEFPYKEEFLAIGIIIILGITVIFATYEFSNWLFSSMNRWPTSSPFDIADWSAYNISLVTSNAYISSLISNGTSTMLATTISSKYNGSLYLLIYLAPKSSEPPVYYPNVAVVDNGKIAEKVILNNTTIYQSLDLRYNSPCAIFSGSVVMYKVQPNTQILIVFPKNFTATGYVVLWYIYSNEGYLFQLATASEQYSPYAVSVNNHVSIFP